MPAQPIHTPVLLDAVVTHLALRPGLRCVDATIDGGGHAAALLAATAPSGIVLGIDRDPDLLQIARERLAAAIACGRLRLVHASFGELERVVVEHMLHPVNAVLFDLGVSSFHFDVSGRGFSFAHNEPLDMRFDPGGSDTESAAQFLATRSSQELTRVFREFGEERFASRIARTVVAWRRQEPITTTQRLLDAVTASLPPSQRWRAARHAARIFQAARIVVNDELGALTEALPQAAAVLAPGGRLAVISFHSLEDRIVKRFLRAEADAGRLRIITRKPLQPDATEIEANPRAASAKLRVAERV
jgi:16S rRNA (cytosine1402-N4)-methyltransferase